MKYGNAQKRKPKYITKIINKKNAQNTFKNNDTNFSPSSKMVILLLILFIILIYSRYPDIPNNIIKTNTGNTNPHDIRFIITNSPSHYNFGDEAILMSTQQFLKFYFPDIEQIVITRNENMNNINLIKYIIKKNDIIIINGGGYFGLYETYIRAEAKIIKTFQNNHIIFFPCTIIYPEQKKENEYKKYINIFNSHKKITLFTREDKSYEVALNLFPNITIYKVPDIATRLNLSFVNKTIRRKGVLLIFRNNEVLLDQNDRDTIENIVKKYFNIIYKRSTKLPFTKETTQDIRRNNSIEFIKFAAERKLIITDRLHGSLFSIITGTPCIILGNKYHKVESSYNSWFKNFSYVYFIKKEDINDKFEETLIRLNNHYNNNNFPKYDYNIFNKYYLLMKNIIQEKIDIINKENLL